MKTLLTTAAVLMSMTASAFAAPLNPAHLPKDAKWVIHVDCEELSDMELVKKLRDAQPQRVEKVRDWMLNHFGVDPQKDLKSLTLFGDNYGHDSGAMIMSANFDWDRANTDALDNPEVKKTEWEGRTLYTFPVESKKGKKMVTSVGFDEQTLVFAPSVEQAKAVVQVLAGNSPSLEGVDSHLTADAPQGSAVYGAATKLNTISPHSGVFPILQQHKRIEYAFGERDGKMFEETTFVADNEEVAEQMEKALNGFVALARVWTGESEPLSRVYDSVAVDRDGEQVQANWTGDTQDVLAAFKALKGRAQQWKEAAKK